MRVLLVVASLLAMGLAGCAAGPPEAPRTETLRATFRNQPDREFGDLLDEPLTISYRLVEGDGPSAEVQVAPGETAVADFDVARRDEATLWSHARSASGASTSSTVTIRQAVCGHLDVVHLDIRYYAKLTAGSWEWGGEWSDDCSSGP